MKILTGDQILITGGKDKGQKGVVEKVFPKENKVVAQGLNVYKRFRKGFGNQAGSVIEFSRPLPMGNVSLLCPSCGKQTRVKFEVDKNGDKTRICAKCKKTIQKGKS